MSKPTFIAIEETLDAGGFYGKGFSGSNPSKPFLLPISWIKGLACDDKECHLYTMSLDNFDKHYIATKEKHPNTYNNLSQYSKSKNVFRAS